jgi:hypothetical protein
MLLRPRPEVTAVKSAMDLNTSKWAAEVPTISSTAKGFTAKSAKTKSIDQSAKGSNTQLIPRDGKTRTTKRRTYAGPGFALLVADAAAAAAAAATSSESASTNADPSVANLVALTGGAVEPPLLPVSQAATPNTPASLTASVVNAQPRAASRFTIHSLGHGSNTAGPMITPEPRVRVINQRRPLGQSAARGTVHSGGESFRERQDDQDDSDSEELDL